MLPKNIVYFLNKYVNDEMHFHLTSYMFKTTHVLQNSFSSYKTKFDFLIGFLHLIC